MYIGIAIVVIILFFVVSGMFSKGRTRKIEKQLREQIALYVTDISTDFAFDFLSSRPKDKPFCMLLHFKAPHDDWQNAGSHSPWVL